MLNLKLFIAYISFSTKERYVQVSALYSSFFDLGLRGTWGRFSSTWLCRISQWLSSPSLSPTPCEYIATYNAPDTKLTGTYEDGRVLDVSAHLKSRALVSQSTSALSPRWNNNSIQFNSLF
jgi:hypothetical protein